MVKGGFDRWTYGCHGANLSLAAQVHGIYGNHENIDIPVKIRKLLLGK